MIPKANWVLATRHNTSFCKMSCGLYHFVPKTCWASGVKLSQAAGPLLSTVEMASCGCSVTAKLLGNGVSSPASLSIGSFWFRYCICGRKHDIILINRTKVSVLLLVQAENVFGRISQVLTTAVILEMVCPLKIAVCGCCCTQCYIMSACSNKFALTATPARNLLRAHQCGTN
jgi:hypothetical protein